MFISSSKGKKNEQNEEMANRRTVPQSIYWRKHLFKQYLWKIFTAAPPPSRKSPHRLSSFIPAVNNSSSSSEHFLGIHKFLQRYIILQSELWNAQLSSPTSSTIPYNLTTPHSLFKKEITNSMDVFQIVSTTRILILYETWILLACPSWEIFLQNFWANA